MDALAAADDFSETFGCDEIDAERDFRSIVSRLKIERLHGGRIAVDHDGPVEVLGQEGFVGVAEVASPYDFAALCLKLYDRLVVTHAMERSLDRFELGDVAFQHF